MWFQTLDVLNLPTVQYAYVRLQPILVWERYKDEVTYSHAVQESGSREDFIPIGDVEYPIRMGNTSYFCMQKSHQLVQGLGQQVFRSERRLLKDPQNKIIIL